MSPVSSSPTPVRCPAARRGEPHARTLPQILGVARRPEAISLPSPLGRYRDPSGRVRELLAVPGHDKSVLILDRDATTLCDRRLVAHLAADEPCENAALVARLYLADTTGRWCRPVRPEDLRISPLAEVAPTTQSNVELTQPPVIDRDGNAYRLRRLAGEHSTVQLRWCHRRAAAEETEWEQVRLRDVIAALESYEPMRSLTERVIACHRDDPNVLVRRLRIEFERLCDSPIVLNRALREALLDAIEQGASMNEIALRCGVVKRDHRGRLSGETSWLARRCGIMAEGGRSAPTPWIHTDVLATIAREGLGISPREVELQ